MKQSAKKAPLPPATKASRIGDFWIYLGLLIAVGIIYGRTADFDFLAYRDPQALLENSYVRNGFTLDGLAWAFKIHESGWTPLAWIARMVEAQLFGLQSGWHHAINVCLHAAAVLLLFAFLKRVTRAIWPSALAALAFAVHPVQVEPVAWVAEQPVLLGSVFCIAALWAYARFVATPSTTRYAAFLAFACMALMASPAMAILAVALFLIDYWPLGKFSIREKVPVILLAAATLILSFKAFERPHLDLWKMIVPMNLAIPAPPAGWWEMIMALAIISTGWALRARPYLFAGFAWLAITFFISPYLAVIGFGIAVAWLAIEISRPAAIAGVAIAALWAVIASINIGYWQNSVTLFQRATEMWPENARAHNQLANALVQERRFSEAIAEFQIAAKIRSDDPEINQDFGRTLSTVGRDAEAIRLAETAERARPDSAGTRAVLGSVLLAAEQWEQAASQFEEALRIEPRNREAKAGLGIALAEQGRQQEAAAPLQASLPALVEEARFFPDSYEPHLALGRIYGFLGRADDSISELSAAARLGGDAIEPHCQLARAQLARSRVNDAFEEISKAFHVAPDAPKVRFLIAEVYFRLDKRAEAVDHLAILLKTHPDYPRARETYENYHRIVYGN